MYGTKKTLTRLAIRSLRKTEMGKNEIFKIFFILIKTISNILKIIDKNIN